MDGELWHCQECLKVNPSKFSFYSPTIFFHDNQVNNSLLSSEGLHCSVPLSLVFGKNCHSSVSVI